MWLLCHLASYAYIAVHETILGHIRAKRCFGLKCIVLDYLTTVQWSHTHTHSRNEKHAVSSTGRHPCQKGQSTRWWEITEPVEISAWKKTKEQWNSIPSFLESGMQILRLKVSEVNMKSQHTKHQASICWLNLNLVEKRNCFVILYICSITTVSLNLLHLSYPQLSSVQSLSRVWLFVTPWTTAHQASLSVRNSRSLLKLMSIKSVMPYNHLILCRPLLLLPSMGNRICHPGYLVRDSRLFENQVGVYLL